MTCSHCKDIMIQERFYSQGQSFDGWRCIKCGNIEDELILENRAFVLVGDGKPKRLKEETEILTWR